MGYALLTAGLGCSLWCLFYSLGVWTVLRSARLANVKVAPSEDWPRLSIVFAARDEEEEIGAALEALMCLDYPSLEVIAVDDRSTDSTGRIIDEMASRDSRLKAVHIDTLPEGWLGKVNALDRGFRESAGEWVLFTDADVKLAPDTLRKALSFADQRDAEHVVLFPKLLGASYLLEVAFVAFSILFMTGTRAFMVGRPGSKAYIGVGAFNLVKREALERSKGFEWLRMEVGDDVGLGLLMRDAGARTIFAFAGMGVHLVWYENLSQMVRGMEKNMFMTSHYRYHRLALQVTLLTAFGLSPLVLLLPSAPVALKALAALALLLSAGLGIASRGLFISRITPYFLGPLGFLLVTFMILNSGIKCALRGGIIWRETFYPIDLLRKGQRVRL
jgi:cellulose synthase/poly-beta-1,6-N-acetylglucosamine synthase-like glycosyltransferase